MDDSIAKVSGDTVEIFGQRFPLKWPFYFPSGKLEGFAIDQPTIINYMGYKIPIAIRIFVYEDGKFHGSSIYKKYTYEHQGQLFLLAGATGLLFYPSGKLERFTVRDKTETNFIIDGVRYVLRRLDTVILHEKTGLPKKIIMNLPRSRLLPYIDRPEDDYNVLEISEDGKTIKKVLEERLGFSL
jgi:hypothetical protein